jgi:hypothetical protein
MAKQLFLGCFGMIVVFLIFVLIFGGMWLSASNGEARLRNQITAKQKDNTSQLDNTIKVITQNAQVTQEQREALKDVIVGNAEARATHGGSLATLVHEAVPNMDQTTATYRQLMNTITAARNSWTENQTALLDLKREHDNLIDTQPSRFFVHTMGGKEKIEVVIVTSTRTDQSFQTGKDDNTDVFGKGK